MTVVNESLLRTYYIKTGDKEFRLPHGAILTPAAKDYAREHGIELLPAQTVISGIKPQHMTSGHGGELIPKNESVIRFRGKLDSTQAIIVTVQCKAQKVGDCALVEKLGEVLQLLREIMRAEVLNKPLECGGIWGQSWSELHDASHNPNEYFGVSHTLPDYTMGEIAANLNYLRTQVRETELAAIDVFYKNGEVAREDILTVLNRLSSAIYVLFLRQITGAGGTEGFDG